MQNVCQDEVEVVKKERYAASHRCRDLRLVAKNLESEIAATESAKKELEVVVNDTQYLLDNGKGRKEPEDAPPRVLTAEEKSRHNQTIRETRTGIQNYDRDLIAKRAQLTRANEDAERAEARAAESVARLAQINMRLRSSSVRLMGHDRFGSLYFWIDLGYSDEQTFPIPIKQITKYYRSRKAAQRMLIWMRRKTRMTTKVNLRKLKVMKRK
ncbi:hypothetical protein BCR33DRAFT_114723 [Rhizoclosmatium globosum]|uniref:Uncharacterized protein n=1 Tax=Rhizoclosmatium globosum TaxID=329046 RepID=A0A1Y2CIZ0_9FUNG|nr:hypothetical protein BCR33DRAFT_114723 [Rhizoclosmatium globosum]|eukprot:ORY46992.1 hypothetical protein BCR33DRAFT_114723 [Rhizoclosmatium globosum]